MFGNLSDCTIFSLAASGLSGIRVSLIDYGSLCDSGADGHEMFCCFRSQTNRDVYLDIYETLFQSTPLAVCCGPRFRAGILEVALVKHSKGRFQIYFFHIAGMSLGKQLKNTSLDLLPLCSRLVAGHILLPHVSVTICPLRAFRIGVLI